MWEMATDERRRMEFGRGRQLLQILCAVSVVLCRSSPMMVAVATDVEDSASSRGSFLMDQVSLVVSSVAPAVNQMLSSAEESGGGGPSPGLGVIFDMGRKAAEVFSSSWASDQTRESLWVPLHEQLGLVRDFLGLPADDSQGVKSAARLLVASQIPLHRFASEREACTSAEGDRKALRLVTEHPATKKMLASYVAQEPDRNLKAAPAELKKTHEELNEYVMALKGSVDDQVLPVSLLSGMDVLSGEIAIMANRYLGTVARYFSYTDRFPRNKRSLAFFAKHVLPRLLQLYALQLDSCRHLWRFLSELPSPASQRFSGAEFSTEQAELGGGSIYQGEGGGAIGAIAQNLGFKTVSSPYAHARAFGRRMLARVQVQIDALYALSRGCLSGTSLEFQRQFAEAQEKVEMGELPAYAFSNLIPQSEQSEKSSDEAAGAETVGMAMSTEPRNTKNSRLRALMRGEMNSQQYQQPAEKWQMGTQQKSQTWEEHNASASPLLPTTPEQGLADRVIGAPDEEDDMPDMSASAASSSATLHSGRAAAAASGDKTTVLTTQGDNK